VHVARPSVELDDPGGDAVENVAVVGHDHEPAAEGCQARFEPGYGSNVYVICRLVEHEQVDFGDQRTSQRDPLCLPAGQR